MLKTAPSTSKRSAVDLGQLAYDVALKEQLKWHAERVQDQVRDTLLLVEHDPVITVGRSGGWEFLKTSQESLQARGILLRDTDRGGKITYHGPGQLVGYPIIKLSDWDLSVGDYIKQLQMMLIAVIRELGLETTTQDQPIGVWTLDGKKIASIGVRVAQGVTRHGFALNINNDLSPFDLMNPCGLSECQMSSLEREGIHTDIWSVKKKIMTYWHNNFGSDFIAAPLAHAVLNQTTQIE